MKKNRFFITMGDPLGIGPEIIAKLLLSDKLPKGAHFSIVGLARSLFEALHSLDSDFMGKWANCEKNENFKSSNSDFLREWANCKEKGSNWNWDMIDMPYYPDDKGKIEKYLNDEKNLKERRKIGGHLSLEWVKYAASQCLEGQAQGMITGPICKESWDMAGCEQMGHTDFLADRCGLLGQERLLLIYKKMRVAHVTCHQSLKDAINMIDKERILSTIILAESAIASYLGRRPKVGVAGLNPHCGEGGLMGDEEIKHIIPAILEAQKMGMDIKGPVSPDTIFAASYYGIYDLVISMIHDHGHIGVKTRALSFGKKRNTRGVNVTLGLPFIRTSVDHGVAFDIAGKNIGDPGSLLDAIKVAVKLGRKKERK